MSQKVSRLTPPVLALLLATAMAGPTVPAFGAPPDPAPLPDDFLGALGAFSDRVFLSADGRVFVLDRYGDSAGALMWTPTGMVPIANAGDIAGMSADGTTFAGNLNGVTSIWNDGGTITLADFGRGAKVLGFSANGKVAFGEVWHPDGGTRPAIWDTSADPDNPGKLIYIPDLVDGTKNGRATAVSDNGKVVVYYQWSAAYNLFIWEDGVSRAITDAPGGLLLSGDGSVIASTSGFWRLLGGVDGVVDTSVRYLPGATSTEVSAISYDGKIMIGQANFDTGAGVSAYRQAFRWIEGTGTRLGALAADKESMAVDMSADGAIVVGWSKDAASRQQAVRWNAAGDIYTIASLLERGGVAVDSSYVLTEATIVSDDGNTIVGQGGGGSSWWITHCTEACNVLVDGEVLGTSFAGLGAMGATASTYLGTELNAAGAMAARSTPGGVTGFAYGAFDSDPTSSATIGASYDLGNDLVIVGSLGIAGIETLLPYDGVAHFSGPSATIALASTPDTGFNWLVGGSLIGLSGTVERGYLNGSTPVTSSGGTTGSGAGFTAQAGFTFNDLIADTLVTPFVSVTVSSMSYAGYTETSGPFPASFQPVTTSSALLRLGTEFSREFAPGSTVSAGLSYGHNFGNGGTVSGSAAGLSIAVPGAAPVSDFVEASVGLDMPLSEQIDFSGRLAAILPLTGAPASIQARAGITMSF